uniref:RdRp n=1 Tax=viral metagenome TaxID=1070528 RepID=A0A2V0RK39_9ZZZZ
MDTMTYAGLRYTTTHCGSYTSRHPDSLTAIKSHTMTPINRLEEQTLMDPWMHEAFSASPRGYDFSTMHGWSRSYYTHQGHMDSLLRIKGMARPHRPNDFSMSAVDDYTRKYFLSFPKVMSMDFKTDLDQVPFEPSSSAGMTLPGKKGDEGNLTRAINQAYATIKDCMRGNLQHQIDESVPDIAYTRTQLTQISKGVKVRNVFGQAFKYILLEGLAASPLMDFFCDNDTFFFIGKDPRIHLPYLFEEAKAIAPNLVTIDWSAFDTTVEPWEIETAFDLLELMLEFPNDESRAAFEFTKIFFINRKIAAPDGTTYFKEKAVPSGSYYTILIDSIINWRRILYMHHRYYGTFPTRIWTQGDDGLIATQDNVTPEGLGLGLPPRHFWTFNGSKCVSASSASLTPFLQRRLKWGDQARDVTRVERLAIYPEYEVDDPQISAFRARALWEDCNYESHILAFATAFLEHKYGITDSPPRRFKPYWQILFRK